MLTTPPNLWLLSGSSEPGPHGRVSALLRIIRQVMGEHDPDAMMRLLLAETVTLLRADAGSVARWHEDEGVLKRVWNTHQHLGYKALDIRPGEGIGGQAISLRRPVISNDYVNDGASLDRPKRAGLRAGIAAPLLRNGQVLGAIMIGSSHPSRHFTSDDADSLEILADVAASVLEGLRQARLAGVLLAARTAQHHLNNQLATTVGYADMLAEDSRLPDDLREVVALVLESALGAAETVNQLRRVTHLEESDVGSPDGRVINLARSVDP